jgi:ribonuclease HII
MSLSDKKLVMGIDEAGRGPIIGPMIVAGVVFEEDLENELIKIGVRDSKRIGQKRREKLFYQILEKAVYVIVRMISPKDVDENNINEIELDTIVRMIIGTCMSLNRCPDKIIIDAVGNPSGGEKYIRAKTGHKNVMMRIAADSNYPVVSAASIVAKVLREWHIERLKKSVGEFGSGYPSDIDTILWLENNKKLAEMLGGIHVRRKWETYKKHVRTYKGPPLIRRSDSETS